MSLAVAFLISLALTGCEPTPPAGSPGGAVVRDRTLLIPDSYNGLLVYDDFVKTLGLDVDERSFAP